MSLIVGIHENRAIFEHSTRWNRAWIKACEKRKWPYEIVDGVSSEAPVRVREYSHLLWHISHLSPEEMLVGPRLLRSAELAGIQVFPNHQTLWHFDDKVAQHYLLSAVDAPVPAGHVFVSRKDARSYFQTQAHYPLVAKLRRGSGSYNVTLLKNKKAAMAYTERMFSKGFAGYPSLVLKLTSHAKTATNLKDALRRLQRVGEFLRARRRAAKFPREKGYVFVQEFIPNEGFDIKLIVVNDKATYFTRPVRKGDFRASGGGTFEYRRDLVPLSVVMEAFRISRELGFQSMGYDVVIDKRTGEGKIVEMSYGFDYTAAVGAEGFWDADGCWHQGALNAPEEILLALVDT